MLGGGWTCSYDHTLNIDSSGNVLYRDGNGRRNIYRPNGNDFTTPPGRRSTLHLVNGLYELHRPDGATLHFNSNGLLSSLVDRRERTMRYLYDENNRLTRVVSPHGREIEFQYVDGRVETIVHPDGNETTLEYAGAGANAPLAKITDPLGKSIEYAYDADGRIRKETLKNGATYYARYTTTTRQLLDVNSNAFVQLVCTSGFPDGSLALLQEDDVTYTDGRDNDWLIRRDKYGHIVRVTAPNGGPSRQYFWGDSTSGYRYNRIYRILDELENESTWDYDANGNVISFTDAADNVTSNAYEHESLAQFRTSQRRPEDRLWSYDYDSNGDLLEIVDPLEDVGGDQTITYTYETWDENTGTSGYGPLPGRIKTITKTDRSGIVRAYAYSPKGHITRITVNPGGIELTTDFEYDAMGRVTRQTVHRGDQDVLTHWSYDPLGRMLTESVDSNGLALETTYAYDDYGNLTRLTDPRGIETALEFDHRNRLREITADDGGVQPTTMSWTLDGNGNIRTSSDPNGHITRYFYNDRDALVKVRDAEDFVTAITRDARNLPTEVRRWFDVGSNGTAAESRTVNIYYDSLRRVTKRAVGKNVSGLPDFDVTSNSFVYERPSGGCGCSATPGVSLPHKLTDPAGKITYLHYDELNRVSKVVRKVNDAEDDGGDSDDAVTTYSYDAGGLLTKTIYPENEEVQFGYDDAGRRTQITVKNPGDGDLVTTWAYDGADNVVSAALANKNTFALAYDGANRLVEASDKIGLIESVAYDANGNVLTSLDGNSNGWRFEYDTLDRLTKVFDPLRNQQTAYLTFAYDAAGNRTSMTDALGIVTSYVYDDVNRLTRMIEDVNGGGVNTDYAYNGLGLLKSLADADENATTYDYDPAARVTRATYPDSGIGTNSVTYVYDLANSAIKRTDQNGITATTRFNDLRQLVSRVFRNESQDVLLNEQYRYDRSSRLLSAINAQAKVFNAYDAVGRIIETQQHHVWPGGSSNGFTTTIAYDVDSNSTRTIHYPEERTVVETVDYRGRMVGVNGGSGIGGTWTFDAGNRRTGAALANFFKSGFSYDANDRLTDISHYHSAPPFPMPIVHYAVEYGYDEVGNRTSTRNLGREDHSQRYRYDDLNRLTMFRRGTMNTQNNNVLPANGLVDSIKANEEWWYQDDRSNWYDYWKQVGGPSADWYEETRAHNGANEVGDIERYLGVSTLPTLTPVFDANGNLTLDPLAPNVGASVPDGQRYEYDPANRLTRTRRTNDIDTNGDDERLLDIGYDALGRRIESDEYIDTDGVPLADPQFTLHVYVGLAAIEEYAVTTNGAGGYNTALLREFVWGERFPEPVAMIDHTDLGEIPSNGTPEVLHYLHDVLGSVVALTNTNGQRARQSHPGQPLRQPLPMDRPTPRRHDRPVPLLGPDVQPAPRAVVAAGSRRLHRRRQSLRVRSK